MDDNLRKVLLWFLGISAGCAVLVGVWAFTPPGWRGVVGLVLSGVSVLGPAVGERLTGKRPRRSLTRARIVFAVAYVVALVVVLYLQLTQAT